MKKCLIVVDYQNDFVCGALGFSEAAALESRITDKIMRYKNAGDDVIFTLDTHDECYLDSFEGQHLPILHCVKGTAGHELYGTVAAVKEDTDILFEKTTFGSDTLFAHLQRIKYTEIEIVGVVTEICVLANAVLARTAQPETQITVDAACVASGDVNGNAAALKVMESLQIKVTNKDGETNES